MATDSELLDAWASGDTQAGRAVYERHAERLARILTPKVGDDAADLVQQTFTRCLQARREGRRIDKVRAYLLTVARNALYDLLRGHARDRQRFSPAITSLHDLGTSPSLRAANHQQQRLLLQALHRIPLDAQLAIELYYWEELPMQEVAEVLGVTKSAAINRVHRARALLRERMLGCAAAPDLVEQTMQDFEDWARSLRSPSPGVCSYETA